MCQDLQGQISGSLRTSILDSQNLAERNLMLGTGSPPQGLGHPAHIHASLVDYHRDKKASASPRLVVPSQLRCSHESKGATRDI